jgi:hypothetical protein
MKGVLYFTISNDTYWLRSWTFTYKETQLMRRARAGSGFDLLTIPSTIELKGYGTWDLTTLSEFKWMDGFMDYKVSGSDQSAVCIADNDDFLIVFWGAATSDNMDLMETWIDTLKKIDTLSQAYEAMYFTGE